MLLRLLLWAPKGVRGSSAIGQTPGTGFRLAACRGQWAGGPSAVEMREVVKQAVPVWGWCSVRKEDKAAILTHMKGCCEIKELDQLFSDIGKDYSKNNVF